jgi:small multidrug resistance family-3 protein
MKADHDFTPSYPQDVHHPFPGVSMLTPSLLLLAAILEVGGDALIRSGLKTNGILLMLAGAAVLIAYGFMVNLTKLDFGRLMGIYIVLFFLIAQLVSVLIFKEKMPMGVIVGGSLVTAGGLLMTLWH